MIRPPRQTIVDLDPIFSSRRSGHHPQRPLRMSRGQWSRCSPDVPTELLRRVIIGSDTRRQGHGFATNKLDVGRAYSWGTSVFDDL